MPTPATDPIEALCSDVGLAEGNKLRALTQAFAGANSLGPMVSKCLGLASGGEKGRSAEGDVEIASLTQK